MYYKNIIIGSGPAGISAASEILQNGKLGYLTRVNNEKKLAKKIEFILSNYTQALFKARLATKYLYRFDEDSQCKKYENFLKKFFFFYFLLAKKKYPIG